MPNEKKVLVVYHCNNQWIFLTRVHQSLSQPVWIFFTQLFKILTRFRDTGDRAWLLVQPVIPLIIVPRQNPFIKIFILKRPLKWYATRCSSSSEILKLTPWGRRDIVNFRIYTMKILFLLFNIFYVLCAYFKLPWKGKINFLLIILFIFFRRFTSHLTKYIFLFE